METKIRPYAIVDGVVFKTEKAFNKFCDKENLCVNRRDLLNVDEVHEFTNIAIINPENRQSVLWNELVDVYFVDYERTKMSLSLDIGETVATRLLTQIEKMKFLDEEVNDYDRLELKNRVEEYNNAVLDDMFSKITQVTNLDAIENIVNMNSY